MKKTNKMDSLVSVIIPVYNCERYVAEAIESVLAQTYKPTEIIVVDDGSTDKSAKIVKQYIPSVQYAHQSRNGSGAARNHGIELAHGNFFSFLDADDTWMKDKLTYQMEAFKSNPGLDMVFGHVKNFYSPDLPEHMKNKIFCPSESMPGVSSSTMLIKRESFVRAGAFVTNWQLGEFLDWYIRAKERGLTNFMVPRVFLRRRIHADNTGIRDRDSRNDYVRILKASLDRRRRKLCK
jgi:glycosyltransferase involved in cell wall biosynthesis